MDLFKKEWKAILIGIWLVIVTLCIIRMGSQLNRLNETTDRVASTLDSVESIAISTDGNVIQMSKKVGAVESNTSYLVQRLKKR